MRVRAACDAEVDNLVARPGARPSNIGAWRNRQRIVDPEAVKPRGRDQQVAPAWRKERGLISTNPRRPAAGHLRIS
jgi:hypothetical protein